MPPLRPIILRLRGLRLFFSYGKKERGPYAASGDVQLLFARAKTPGCRVNGSTCLWPTGVLSKAPNVMNISCSTGGHATNSTVPPVCIGGTRTKERHGAPAPCRSDFF